MKVSSVTLLVSDTWYADNIKNCTWVSLFLIKQSMLFGTTGWISLTKIGKDRGLLVGKSKIRSLSYLHCSFDGPKLAESAKRNDFQWNSNSFQFRKPRRTLLEGRGWPFFQTGHNCNRTLLRHLSLLSTSLLLSWLLSAKLIKSVLNAYHEKISHFLHRKLIDPHCPNTFIGLKVGMNC